MEIKGFIPNTMLDWEGMIASTLFLPGCNFRCPFCQNPDLVLSHRKLETVPFELVADYLREREGWVEGVCITGGEPCLHSDLPDFCAGIKALGLKVKVDTNGSLPGALERLLERGLVDYVAMDVKAPLEPGPYRLASGCSRHDLLDSISRSISMLSGSGVEHEFRTTVVPMIHNPEDILRIARVLSGDARFVLQQFRPAKTLDRRFQDLKPFDHDEMESMLDRVRRLVPAAKLRASPEVLRTERGGR